MKEFDSCTCPLSGVHMVEAAAGTGKTYNIQNLVLRLLLEYPLHSEESKITVGQILVVTFTNAATAELRTRIRSILQYAQWELTGCDYPQAARESGRIRRILAHVREFLGREGAEEEEINAALKERIRNALTDFDSSAVSTIHGFCQTVLTENAFQSGVLFNTRIEQHPEELIHDMLMDFYRSEFYGGGTDEALFRGQLREALGIMPDDYADRVEERRKHPDMKYRTDSAVQFPYELAPAEAEIKKLFGETLRTFDPGLLENWPAMKAGTPYTENGRREAAEILSGDDTVRKLKTLALYAPERISEFVPVRARADFERITGQDFFIKNALLQKKTAVFRQVLERAAVEYALRKFEKQKLRDNFQTFDDLLQQIQKKSRDEQFCLTMRKRFKAAIVDEFQDTDPVQYEIFRNIFFSSSLFMVGDPRQAIYGFRGGDIAAYRHAGEELAAANGTKSGLLRNFRSSEPMINAVNKIFCRSENGCENLFAFADSSIVLDRISAGESDGEKISGYSVNGAEVKNPLRITKCSLKQSEVYDLCVRQIVSMLNDRSPASCAELPGRGKPGILPGDIAILTASNRQAAEIKRKLAEYNVPAVVRKNASVFDSFMASELETVLKAVANPTDREQLLRALNSAVFGSSIEELAVCRQNNISPDRGGGADFTAVMQENFSRLKKCWTEESFSVMFQALLNTRRQDNNDVRSGVLAGENGGRNLTDLLQLRDLLAAESRQRRLSVAGVLNFLEKQRSGRLRNRSEEYETMLETDRAAVTVMTVHSSKGLEFPFVFLPCLHSKCARVEDGLFHDPADGCITRDLTADNEHKKLVYAEEMQENLRLAYVAVTRAKYYCHIFWGGRSKHSALDWLFRMRKIAELPPPEDMHGALDGSKEDPLAAIPAEWLADCDTIPQNVPPYIPADADYPELNCRKFERSIDKSRGIASYSALTTSSEGGGRDYDAAATQDEDEKPPEGIFTVPRSAVLGNAWHEIFEKLDFQQYDFMNVLEELTGKSLDRFGITGPHDAEERRRLVALSVQMVKNVLEAPLPEAAPGFTLSGLSREHRLSELEFHFGIRNKFALPEVKSVLNDYVREKFGNVSWELQRKTVSGFLKGFIDLIFYCNGKFFIADWKSNSIGCVMDNFHRDGLRREVFSHLYFLQYLIYSVALIKFLKQKLHRSEFTPDDYEKYYGGVYYFFVRGVSPGEPSRGVWHDRPGFELLKKLESVIG